MCWIHRKPFFDKVIQQKRASEFIIYESRTGSPRSALFSYNVYGKSVRGSGDDGVVAIHNNLIYDLSKSGRLIFDCL